MNVIVKARQKEKYKTNSLLFLFKYVDLVSEYKTNWFVQPIYIVCILVLFDSIFQYKYMIRNRWISKEFWSQFHKENSIFIFRFKLA